MKKLKLFFALFAMLALGVGNAWGTVYFEDNFSNVGTGTNSFSSRSGWISLTQCYPQYNTGVRIGSSNNAGAITKTAITEISGTKDLKVTIYTAKYNNDGNSFTITTTNGTITSATGVGTLSNGTLTVQPTNNAGVTSTTSKATWTDDYKTEFIISGANSTTTIKFATNKRAILGPITIEDASSTGGGETPGEGGEEPETPEGGGDAEGETYELVTSISSLEAGAKYIIGNSASGSSIFMSTATNTNNRKPTSAITVIDNKVTTTEEVLVLELGGETDAWTFRTTNYTETQGFLTSAASGKNNYCKVVATAEACSYFTIAFNNQEAIITSTGRNERNILRYNGSNGSSLFACYSSGQSPVYLYKLTTSSGGDEGGSGETVDSLTAK